MGQVESKRAQDASVVATRSLNEPFDSGGSANEARQNKTEIGKNATREQDTGHRAKSPTINTSLIADKTVATSQAHPHYGSLASADCTDTREPQIGTARSRILAPGRRRQAYKRGGYLVNGLKPNVTTTEGCIGQCNCCCCCSCRPTASADHPYCSDQFTPPPPPPPPSTTAAATTTDCDNQFHVAPMICESRQCHGLVVGGYLQPLRSGNGQISEAKLSGGTADEKQLSKLVECRHSGDLSTRNQTRLALNPISERIETGNKSARVASEWSAHNVAEQAQRVAPKERQQPRTWRQRHLQCGSSQISSLTGASTDKRLDDKNYESLNRHNSRQRLPEGGLLRPLLRPSSQLDGDSCGDITVSPSTVSSSSSSSSPSSSSTTTTTSSFRLFSTPSSSASVTAAAASLLAALNSEDSPRKGHTNQQPAKSTTVNCHESAPCNCSNAASGAKSTPPINAMPTAASEGRQQQERLNNATGSAASLANEIIEPTKSAGATGGVSLSNRPSSEGAKLGRDSNSAAQPTLASTDLDKAATTETSSQNNNNKSTGDESKRLISPSQQQQQQKQPEQASAGQSTPKGHLAWNDLAAKYGRMSRKQSGSQLVGGIKSGGTIHNTGSGSSDSSGGASDYNNEDHNSQTSGGAYRQRPSGPTNGGSSCLFHILCAILHTLFPILDSLKNYALPGDLLTDLAAGFTVAVLHIPQGMAYGLLSGVEPIYGLYVSFVPVLVMSLMSKSRHVSYGTFAVISMLLVSTVDDVKSSYDAANHNSVVDLIAPTNSSSLIRLASVLPDLVVVTDNHQPPLDSSGIAVGSLAGDLVAANALTSNSNQQQQQQQQPLDSVGGAEATMGPVSTLVGLSAPTNIEILACACLVCGVIHITMSLMHLGVLSLMFSDQLVSSFTTASAIHVLTSQLAGLFDLSLPPIQEELFKIVRVWYRFGHTILFDGCNQLTGLLSVASIAFLLFIKQVIEPALRKRFARFTCLPSELVLMALVTTCSWYYKFASDHQVKIIGHVPTGLPDAKVARLDLVPYVIKDSLTIALVSFAMNLSIAQVYAKKFRYELDANQELFALGTANIVGSFFNCFPCASSLSRSSVQSSLNVRSQLCSLFSCALVVLIICFFAHILHDLPRSTLSCIIVVALKGILVQITDLYANWRLSKLDALVWLSTFLSVIIFGVTYGLILGIMASLFTIFLRLLTPNHSILGRLPETDIYVDVDEFANCQEFNGVKIFRFNSALCYLNRTMLKSKIKQLLPSIYRPTGFSAICSKFHQHHHHHHHHQHHHPSQFAVNPFYGAPSARAAETAIGTASPASGLVSVAIDYLIIDCSALSYCDYSGAATLIELVEDMERERVTVFLAACPLKLIGMLERMNSTEKVLAEHVYPTISDAIGQVRYLAGNRKTSVSCKNSLQSLSSSLKRRPNGDKDQQQQQQQQQLQQPHQAPRRPASSDSSDRNKTNPNSLSSILDVP